MNPAGKSTLTKICVLASGGIDSGLLLEEALATGLEVYPLYIAVGFIWEEAEQFWLQRLLKELSHPHLKSLKLIQTNLRDFFLNHWAYTGKAVPDFHSPDEAVSLPGRNLFLSTHASLYALSLGISEIWMGLLEGNPFPDASLAFFENFEKACREGLGGDIKIRRPFQESKKAELFDRFPAFPYHLTFSCLKPQGLEHCEDCNKCAERRKFLNHAKI